MNSYIDTEISRLYTPEERTSIDSEMDVYIQERNYNIDIQQYLANIKWQSHRKRAAILMMRKLELADLEIEQSERLQHTSEITMLKNIISTLQEYR